MWCGGLAGEEAALADPLFRAWRRLADRPAETWLAALRERERVGAAVFDPNAPEGGGGGGGKGGTASTAAAVAAGAAGAAAAGAPYSAWASLSRKA